MQMRIAFVLLLLKIEAGNSNRGNPTTEKVYTRLWNLKRENYHVSLCSLLSSPLPPPPPVPSPLKFVSQRGKASGC